MKKVITTMLVAAMVLSMAMPTSAATITRKKSSGTTASTTKVSGDYSLKMVDKTLQFIRGGKVVSSIETKDGKITLRKSSKGGISVVFTDANGKRRNITLGAQKTVTLSGTFVQVSVDKALGSSFEVEMEKGSKVTNFYAKGAAKVTLNGSVTTLNVTSSNANVAANGTVTRAYAVNKKSITGMAAGKITQTSTGTSASGSVNTSTGSSSSSNTTVNTGSGSGSSSSSGNSGIIINGGGSNGGTVVKTTAAKEAAKITAAKIGTASVKVGATASEVKAAVEAKAKALVASGYTVTFNQTSAADTSKAGSTSVTGTFTVSKGSDKATTKAITVSVNVTEVTVPAEISSVKADNGRVNIVLAKKPSVVPTDANFKPVIKAYIDGSTTGVNLDGLAFEGYDENSLTVAYKFNPIPATDKEQSIVVGAKLANANEVRAEAFKIPAVVKAAIAKVTALNGSIEIELEKDPSTEVNAESFAPVIKAYIDDKEVALEDVTFVKYDKATKTVSYTFKEIAPAAKAQSVVIGAKLGAADEVRAEAFTVPSVDDVVTATIQSVTATNGEVSIKLEKAPTNDPTADNFQPVLKAYINDAAEGVALDEVTFVEYDKATATVKLSFKAIAATNEAQSVKVGAKLDNGEEKISDPFTIAAATSEIQWTKPLVMPTEGVVDGVLTLSDKPTVLTVEATVEGGVNYQWYKTLASDGTSNAVAIGTNSPSYTMTQDDVISVDVTYFVVATSKTNENVTSTSEKIAFKKIEIPANSIVTPIVPKLVGNDYDLDATGVAPLNAEATNASDITTPGGTISYQWYVIAMDENGNDLPAAPITDETDATFIPPANKIGVNKYYCEVTANNPELSGLKTAKVTTNTVTITIGKTFSADISYSGDTVCVEIGHIFTEFAPKELLDKITVTGKCTKEGKTVDVALEVTNKNYTPDPSAGKSTFELTIKDLDGFIDETTGNVAADSKIIVDLPKEGHKGFTFTPYHKEIEVSVTNPDTLEVANFEPVAVGAATAGTPNPETKQLKVTFNEAVKIVPDKTAFKIVSTTNDSEEISVTDVKLDSAKKVATLTVELPSNSVNKDYKLKSVTGISLSPDLQPIKVVRDEVAPTMKEANYKSTENRIVVRMSENVKLTGTATAADFELYDAATGGNKVTGVEISTVAVNGNDITLTLKASAGSTGDGIPVLTADTWVKHAGNASGIKDFAAKANEFAVDTTTNGVKLIGTEAAPATDMKAEDVKVAAPEVKPQTTNNKPETADGSAVDPTKNVADYGLTVNMAEPFIAETNGSSAAPATDLKDIIQVVGSDNKTYKVQKATPKAAAAPVLKSVKGAVNAYNAIDIQVKLPENVTIKSIKFVIETDTTTGAVTSSVVIKTVANEPVKEIPPVHVDTTTPTKVTAKGTASLTALDTVVVTLEAGSFSDGAKVADNWTIAQKARAKTTLAVPKVKSVVVSGKTATLTLDTKVEVDSTSGKYNTVEVTADAKAFASDTTVGTGSLKMEATFDAKDDTEAAQADVTAARQAVVNSLTIWHTYNKDSNSAVDVGGTYEVVKTDDGFTAKIPAGTPIDTNPNSDVAESVPAYADAAGMFILTQENGAQAEAVTGGGWAKVKFCKAPIGLNKLASDYKLLDDDVASNGATGLLLFLPVKERDGVANVPKAQAINELVLGESATEMVALAAQNTVDKTCNFNNISSTKKTTFEVSKSGVKYTFNLTAVSDGTNITVTVDDGTAELL